MPAQASASPGKAKAKETSAEASEEPTEEDPKTKRSLIRRLLFLGDASEKGTEPKAEEPGTKTTDGKEQPTEEEKKPGFMLSLIHI